jgi:hypothetical protein
VCQVRLRQDEDRRRLREEWKTERKPLIK